MARQVIRTKQFARDAADYIVRKGRAALGERDEFGLALSGGNTPRVVYEELASRARTLPYERVIITFGDERCVPPTDDASNFRMADEALFGPADVPSLSVLRMRGEMEPARAADQYQEQLDALGVQRGEKIYQHDLILLGLGDDGHTASLFPETAALSEMNRRVAANYVAKFQSYRLTVTFPTILAAREVCFLIGANKDPQLIERVFSGDEALPAARVDAQARAVTWIIEEAV